MAIDFSAYNKPFLSVRLRGESAPLLRVMPPTVDLAEALSGAGELLDKVMDSADPECRAALYDYAAQIMSRNREMIPLTAEDLRDKYDTDVEDLVYFFAAYVDFVEGLRNAKN